VFRVPIDFYDKLKNGENPVPYLLLVNSLGVRYFSIKTLSGFFDIEPYLANGQYLADGSIYAGTPSLVNTIERSARLLSISGLDKSLSRDFTALSFTPEKSQQSISFDLDNNDHHFSTLVATEPFLKQEVQLRLGFESLPFSNHIVFFKGRVNNLRLERNKLTIKAVEG